MGPTIFISIASYIDSLVLFTLNEAFTKASFPKCLRFGIVDQDQHNRRNQINTLPYASQVRYVQVSPQDTLGVSWARSLAFSLYDDEMYFLQVDSHTLFEQGWDEKLLTQLLKQMSKSEKPILSAYPQPFTFDTKGTPVYEENTDPKHVMVLRPNKEAHLTKANKSMGFETRYLTTAEAVPGCHLAAGFIFTLGRFIEEVPYDPFLYFQGEEQSLAIRAYTKGWDIYHPLHVPVRHLYKKSGVAYNSHHWHGEVQKERDFTTQHLIERSNKRLNKLLSGIHYFGAYALGHKRTLEDYAAFSGIDYKNLKITDPFNGQLF